MTMTLQELSDRMEIKDLMVDYATAVDTQNNDALDDVFTPDPFIDYTACGGIKGNLEEIKEFLKSALPMFSGTQHMIANSSIKLHGDTAEGVTMCHNPMPHNGDDGEDKLMIVGLWYLDKFVRTDKGWRMKERVERRAYQHNF